ncbi:MAG: hypothetical protein RR356_07830 [Bacteroidales bacterium]
MKKYYFYLFTIIFFCVSSCQKFEPATCDLQTKYIGIDSVFCTATIQNDGGCTYFTEQGYCYSFLPNPSHTSTRTTIEKLVKGTTDTKFTWIMTPQEKDTAYYIRAYVKTNAGIGYSNEKKIIINTPGK